MNSPDPNTLSTSGQRLAKFASITAAATLTSRILGLVREQVLAARFGAGNEMDAFIVAFRIPNMARDLFAEGALSSALVPSFARHLSQHGRRGAWHLGHNILTVLLLATGAVACAGIVFADRVIAIVAPDFAAVPGKAPLTITLTRMMLPFKTAGPSVRRRLCERSAPPSALGAVCACPSATGGSPRGLRGLPSWP